MKNNKLCVAVIGCGTIARARHIPELFENPYIGEVVLAETYENAIADLVTNYHIKRYFTGNDAWKKVVQTEDIDAVIVCTPNALHAPITVSVLNAEKHVMVEKPMAISNAEVQEMCNAAYKNNKLLLVAHHRRHQNCYLIGKTILQSGLLGNITGILAQHKQPGPIEWAPNSTWFFQNAVKGGGVMMDLGIHMADVVSWYCEDEALETKTIITQQGTPYEQARCIVKMKSGCGVVIDVAWGIFAQEKRVTVYCEKGKMIVDEYAESGVVISLTSPFKTSATFVLPAPVPNLAGNPNLGLVDHYIKCIKSGDLQRERLVEHINAMKIVLNEIN